MKRTIMRAIELSELAYCNDTRISNNLLDTTEVLKIVTIPVEGAEGFFYETANEAWVVIRGTEFDSVKDWMANIDCTIKEGFFGGVHKGFYNKALAILMDLHTCMDNALTKKKRLIFTGHSQGAAIATILYSMYTYHNTLCIPIASPRCFAKDAAIRLGKEHGRSIYQVINNNDIVPTVPPKFLGYRHVYNTNLRYINRRGKVYWKITKWKKFCDKLLGYIRSTKNFSFDGIKDHSIERINYLWRNQK